MHYKDITHTFPLNRLPDSDCLQRCRGATQKIKIHSNMSPHARELGREARLSHASEEPFLYTRTNECTCIKPYGSKIYPPWPIPKSKGSGL